jgi:argininosuccinate synthase
MTERVVLAYSGGLDTSVAVPWLRESHGYDVVALTADVGGGADLPTISARALAAGATVAIGVDARTAFVESYVWPALQAGAIYQGIYPLATALARPLIARLLVEAAHETGATLVAHGCTGKGNDQVRFDVAIGALDPSLTVIAPMRKGMGMNRDEELAYARARDIPLEAGTGAGSPYSIDVNLWGRSIEAGVLEDPWVAAPPDAFAWTVDPADAPRTPTEVAIGFEQGIPVTLDGEPLDGVTLIERLNALGGANGVGRIDHLEDRLVGIKSREIYEAPAAVILHLAHAALEQMVLSRDLIAFKHEVGNRLATLTYDGVWFGELANALRGFVASTQNHVNGTVRLRLVAGSASVVGRTSPDTLYRHDLATYGAEDSFDQAAAVGFIALWGLPVRTQSAIHGSAIHNGSLLDQLGAIRRTADATAPDAAPGTPVGPAR